jgi:hypothetical protein
MGSLQTYELSLPSVKKLKTIALKASKKKAEVSFGDDSKDEEKSCGHAGQKFRKTNEK